MAICEMITVQVAPGKLEEFHDFWVRESLPYWEKHGIKHIGSWESMIGNDQNEVIRMFEFRDFTHYEQWRKFLAEDEEGKRLRKKLTPYLLKSKRLILRPY
ncbi:MAG: NIPSNAP family protein [Chloroflexi bacterium]|nr:NIPSNAP family protein [Chloroflexota bacterium]